MQGDRKISGIILKGGKGNQYKYFSSQNVCREMTCSSADDKEE